MTATTELTSWSQIEPYSADPTHTVVGALGDFADDYDIEGLTRALIAAVNQRLPELSLTYVGIVYGPYDYKGNATEEVREAYDAVDFFAIAEQYDRTAGE
jgi:hypothetical protein